MSLHNEALDSMRDLLNNGQPHERIEAAKVILSHPQPSPNTMIEAEEDKVSVEFLFYNWDVIVSRFTSINVLPLFSKELIKLERELS